MVYRSHGLGSASVYRLRRGKDEIRPISVRERFTYSEKIGGASSRELLFERDERAVDVPLVDTVDVAGSLRDPPPVRLVVPPFLAPAEFARALLRRCDGHAHVRTDGTAAQKDIDGRRAGKGDLTGHRRVVRFGPEIGPISDMTLRSTHTPSSEQRRARQRRERRDSTEAGEVVHSRPDRRLLVADIGRGGPARR